MSRQVLVRSEAETDIREAFEYLQQCRSGLGEQFSTELREVLHRIESMPESYGLVWQDVRAARVRKFQYVVYYVTLDERSEVLAVMHGARRESRWRSRRE